MNPSLNNAFNLSVYNEEYSLNPKHNIINNVANPNDIKYEASTVLNNGLQSVWNVLKNETTINIILTKAIMALNKPNITTLPEQLTFMSFASQISNYKKIITYISSHVQLTFTFIVISNTLEKTSLLSLQLISEENGTLNVDDLQNINVFFFRKLEHDLASDMTMMKHYESTTIKANANAVWNFIVNWEYDKLKDKDYSNVQFEGNSKPTKVGSVVTVVVDNEFNAKCKVLFVDKEKDSITWKYGFTLESCRINANKICLTVVKIADNLTFLGYETYFTQTTAQTMLSSEVEEYLSKKKKKLFKEVKKYFENVNYYNENN